MKPAPLAIFTFALALAVAAAWPISSAIGAATASATAPTADVQPAGCVPAPMDDAAPSAEDLDLPPGHPPIPTDRLPPGHPPVSPRLPPGHPPIPTGPGAASAPTGDGRPRGRRLRYT
jgi:hypothetical protein